MCVCDYVHILMEVGGVGSGIKERCGDQRGMGGKKGGVGGGEGYIIVLLESGGCHGDRGMMGRDGRETDVCVHK